MASPVDLLQDASGDIDTTAGVQLTPDLVTYVMQKIGQVLVWFLGEWFLDQRKGFPFWRVLLGQRYDANQVDALYRKALLLVPGVGNVVSLSNSLDAATRTLTVKGEVSLSTGVIVPISFVVPL